MLAFGGIQIVMSQIPDFHNMAWVSIVAAIMSFCYAFIGLALGFAEVIGMSLYFIFKHNSLLGKGLLEKHGGIRTI